MNQTDQSIVLFSPDWRAMGFIGPDMELSLVEADEQTGRLAQWVLSQLTERDPQLMQPIKDNSGCVIGFETASVGDARFLEAVRDELRRANLKSHLIPSGICEALVKISQPRISAELRTQVVPEVLGLPLEQALAALEAVLTFDLPK
jgi:hypothetical protein